MRIKKTKFKGLVVLNGIKHHDKRGYLRELVLEKIIKKKFKFQITSVSKKNVLRGLHFQIKKPQGKLISVIKGEIFDVAVDMRKNSKTFGQHFSIRLNEKKIFLFPLMNLIYVINGKLPRIIKIIAEVSIAKLSKKPIDSL